MSSKRIRFAGVIVGDRGSPCPNIEMPTYLEEFVPELLTVEAVRIRVVYKGYPSPTYEFHASLSQVESNLDADGNVITVTGHGWHGHACLAMYLAV